MRSGPAPRLVLCLLVVLAGAPFVAAGQSGTVTIESFDYAGDGAVATPQDRPYLWQSESHSFEVVLAAGDGGGDYDVCLEARAAEASEPAQLACGAGTVEAGGQAAVVVEVEEWPANLTGELTVTAVVTPSNGSGGEPAARQDLAATVLQRDADPDEDGLTNEREAEAGTGFFTADTDDDGLEDGLEVDTYGTDPAKADTDGDGLADGAEVNDHQTDPTTADTDGDGLTDDLEVDDHGTNPNRADTDGDGLDDAAEVNTYGTDPTEADTDEDGLEDGPEVNVHGTDPSKADTDEDGLSDAAEVNTYGTDPTTADTDGDGLDDGAEVDEYGTNPTKADTDGDGLDDGEEVEAGTDPLTPDAAGAEQSPLPSFEIIGGLFVLAGAVLLGLFAFTRRGTGAGVAGRLRRLGGPAQDGEAGHDGAGTSTGSPAGVAAGPIPTNQNHVLELLAENGGRMLQSDIVDATDWSKSKVSRVLSDMDEEGEIEKIDVGKGNLIALPEVAPPNTGSPLDDREE